MSNEGETRAPFRIMHDEDKSQEHAISWTEVAVMIALSITLRYCISLNSFSGRSAVQL